MFLRNIFMHLIQTDGSIKCLVDKEKNTGARIFMSGKKRAAEGARPKNERWKKEFHPEVTVETWAKKKEVHCKEAEDAEKIGHMCGTTIKRSHGHNEAAISVIPVKTGMTGLRL
jgi:hypothetical protein